MSWKTSTLHGVDRHGSDRHWPCWGWNDNNHSDVDEISLGEQEVVAEWWMVNVECWHVCPSTSSQITCSVFIIVSGMLHNNRHSFISFYITHTRTYTYNHCELIFLFEPQHPPFSTVKVSILQIWSCARKICFSVYCSLNNDSINKNIFYDFIQSEIRNWNWMQTFCVKKNVLDDGVFHFRRKHTQFMESHQFSVQYAITIHFDRHPSSAFCTTHLMLGRLVPGVPNTSADESIFSGHPMAEQNALRRVARRQCLRITRQQQRLT